MGANLCTCFQNAPTCRAGLDQASIFFYSRNTGFQITSLRVATPWQESGMTMAGVTGFGKSGRMHGLVCSTTKEAGVAADRPESEKTLGNLYMAFSGPA